MYQILIFTFMSLLASLQPTSQNKVEVYEHVAGLNKIEVSGIVSKVKGYQTFDASSYFIYIENKVIKISEQEYEKGVVIGEKHSFKGLKKLEPKDFVKYNLFTK